ncbi:ATP-binding protein [Fulvivirga aurantia]|uniref:ATP-binding protein n=1 Tax=Fulvivirga aurantia TaxID=2529383 RepID=UPI00162626EB
MTDFVVLLILLIITLKRRALSLQVKAAVLLIGILIVVSVDVYELSVLSANKVLLILIPFFAIISVSIRKMIWIVAFSIFAMVALAYLHISGLLSIKDGGNLGVVSWIINFMMIIMVAFIILLIVNKFSITYNGLVSSLSAKNNQLTLSEIRLKEYQNHLEELVSKKTHSLSQANKELTIKKKDAEDALKKLQDAQVKLLESEKMASLGLMASGIAHEINNPLNYIKGGVDGIEEQLKSNDLNSDFYKELKPLFEAVHEGVNRASNIVKSMNAYSYTNTEDPQQFEVLEIVNNCINLLKVNLSAIKIDRQYASGQIEMWGYPGKIHQVFLNILTNAFHAIGKSGTITIKSELKNDNLRISISDDGKGISEENQLKIFDPFFTTKEIGKGTGLGLYIVKSIVEEHEGEIEVSSKKDEGTTFRLLFPLESNLNPLLNQR